MAGWTNSPRPATLATNPPLAGHARTVRPARARQAGPRRPPTGGRRAGASSRWWSWWSSSTSMLVVLDVVVSLGRASSSRCRRPSAALAGRRRRHRRAVSVTWHAGPRDDGEPPRTARCAGPKLLGQVEQVAVVERIGVEVELPRRRSRTCRSPPPWCRPGLSAYSSSYGAYSSSSSSADDRLPCRGASAPVEPLVGDGQEHTRDVDHRRRRARPRRRRGRRRRPTRSGAPRPRSRPRGGAPVLLPMTMTISRPTMAAPV